MNELTTADAGFLSICTFRADGRLYGIDVAHVREVNTQVAAAPVPQSPQGVRGLTNLRSRIYLVIDLRPLLGLPSIPNDAESRLIILKPHVAEDVGVLVDAGGDILRVPRGEVSHSASVVRAGPTGDSTRAITTGVCRLESELLVLIDPLALVGEIANQIR